MHRIRPIMTCLKRHSVLFPTLCRPGGFMNRYGFAASTTLAVLGLCGLALSPGCNRPVEVQKGDYLLHSAPEPAVQGLPDPSSQPTPDPEYHPE
jgi:hypothetical protein